MNTSIYKINLLGGWPELAPHRVSQLKDCIFFKLRNQQHPQLLHSGLLHLLLLIILESNWQPFFFTSAQNPPGNLDLLKHVVFSPTRSDSTIPGPYLVSLYPIKCKEKDRLFKIDFFKNFISFVKELQGLLKSNQEKMGSLKSNCKYSWKKYSKLMFLGFCSSKM